MMKHWRQSNDANFGPRLLGSPSKKKRKSRFKSPCMRKIMSQVRRSQASWRPFMRNGSGNANRRGNNVANKASIHCSRTLDSKKVNEKHRQEKLVVATQQIPPKSYVLLSKDLEVDEHSVPIARSACKSNLSLTPPNITKQPTTSKLNNYPVPLSKNKRVISSRNEDKTTSRYWKKSYRLKEKEGLVHKEKNMDKLNQDKNVLVSRSKGRSLLVEGEDINVDKHNIRRLKSLNGQGLPSTSKVSNVSMATELLLPNKEPLNDKRCHYEVMSDKDMEIQGDINVASKEGIFSFMRDGHHEQEIFLKAKGDQFTRETPRNSGNNSTHIFGMPRDNVECNRDPSVECVQLDGTIPNIPNTRFVEGGRDDDAKLKRKRAESVPAKQPKAHVDYDSEDAENSRPMNKQRRYKDKDHRPKFSLPFVSESVKEQRCSYSQPIDEPTWSGIFKLDNKEYVSAAAHLSTKSCEKVWTLSKSLPPVVALTRLSRLEVWPKSWEASRPTGDSIGLYFFPHETRSHGQLVKEVMENNTVLRAVIGKAEMLIFPSNLLPEPYQTFQSRHYLWGVFKSRNDTVTEEEEDKVQCEDSDDETLRERTTRLKAQRPMPSMHPCVEKEGIENSTQHVEASCVPGPNMDAEPIYPEEANRQDVGKELTPSLAGSNAPCPAECNAEATSAPTTPATTSDQGQNHSMSGVPPGRVIAFVVRQKTPKLEKLIQEMDREGVLVVAVQGEMIGSGFGNATATAP